MFLALFSAFLRRLLKVSILMMCMAPLLSSNMQKSGFPKCETRENARKSFEGGTVHDATLDIAELKILHF